MECGPLSVQVSERIPDGVKVAEVQIPFKKGTNCILHLESFGRDSGVWKASGKLEALTDQ